jgi:hypothetical protein
MADKPERNNSKTKANVPILNHCPIDLPPFSQPFITRDSGLGFG